jgi:hypothetical protein
MEMDQSDFISLMGDQLDVEAACTAGRIRFEGDVKLLSELGTILQSKAN